MTELMGGQMMTQVEAARLGVLSVWAMAMALDGSRCYPGVRGGQLGELLAVVDLIGEPGGAAGPARWYRVRTEPVPLAGVTDAVRILSDPAGRKLYLALRRGSATPATSNLAVIDLVDGEPSGTGRVYRSGTQPHSYVNAMARHPHLDLLYVVGHGSPGVAVHPLIDGEPGASPEWFSVSNPGGAGRHDVAVDATGRHLYLGGVGNLLHVVDLDGTSWHA